MKTEVIVVSSKGNGMDLALNHVDELVTQLGLNPKDTMHLRLLVEEMLNLVRSIIGQLECKFWIETTDERYQLHLQTMTLLDREQRKQLISTSTRGKNEAHRGIMGKLRAFFEPLPIDDTPEYLLDTIDTMENGDLIWSLDAYRERLRKKKDTAAGAQEEWDELEKSLVSHLADNIQVSISGYELNLIIYKKIN